MHSVLFLFCANKENGTVSGALFYKNVTDYLRGFFLLDVVTVKKNNTNNILQ